MTRSYSENPDRLLPGGRRVTRKGRLDVPTYYYPYVSAILDEAKPKIKEHIARKRGTQNAVPTDICEWAEQRFNISQTGSPIVLLPHQRGILRLAFTRNANGSFPFTTFLYSTIKQSGKSSIAGLALRWYAETGRRMSELYTIGNDKEQAKLRSFREIRHSLELDPRYEAQRDRIPGEWELQKETMRCLRTGTEIRALAVDAKGEAGGKPALQSWCVDDQTECLTRAGWKLVIDVTTSDEVATLNPETGALVWDHPRAVNVTPYRGKMMAFKHRRAEFVVTPNHRVWGRFAHKTKDIGRSQWRFEEAAKAWRYTHGFLKGDASWQGERDVDSNWAAFVGYVISEGCFQPSHISIAQKRSVHPEIYDRIVAVVDALGYAHTDTPNEIRVRSREALEALSHLGLQHERFIPQEIKDAKPGALRAFFDAYLEGDGHKDTWRYGARPDAQLATTTSKRLADDLCEVGLKLGYHPNLHSYPSMRARRADYHDAYRVGFSRKSIYWSGSGGNWSEIDYDGMVACPSVGSGIFYIRRNGKCCWTGNTEIWGVEYEDALRFWDELTPVPTIPDSMRIVETYAGFVNESELLYSLYQTGKAGHQLSAGEFARITGEPITAWHEVEHDDDPIPVYINEQAGLLMYWDTGIEARRMPWQQGERGLAYYAQQEQTLPAQAFRRLHLNEWSSAESAFIPEQSWDACREEIELLEDGSRIPLVLGVDAGTTLDCFAIVAVSRHPQRHDDVQVRAVRIIDPKEQGVPVDYDEAESFLREVCKRYNVIQIAYDPYQLEQMMQRLRSDSVAWCEPFNQQQDRLRADRSLYDLIITRRITHDGSPRLREHILNAAARLQKDEASTLRLIKSSPRRSIDAAVALSMASARCLYLRV